MSDTFDTSPEIFFLHVDKQEEFQMGQSRKPSNKPITF